MQIEGGVSHSRPTQGSAVPLWGKALCTSLQNARSSGKGNGFARTKHRATVFRMRRRRLHPPTWAEAIETVLHTLLCVAGRIPAITDEEDRILAEVYLRCDDLRTLRHRHAEKTNRELAAKYRISPRTVTNWRREGCPFGSGQARVLGWIARRRYAPAGTEAKFAKQLRKRRNPLRNILAAMRAEILSLRAQHRAHGLPMDDWLRKMPFRER